MNLFRLHLLRSNLTATSHVSMILNAEEGLISSRN